MAIPLAAAAVGALGALIGGLFQSGEEAAARAEIEKARKKFGDIVLPELERAVAEQLGPSEAGKVFADPALKDAQMHALSKMQEMEQGGGFTLEDKAALNQIQNQLARKESAGRGAITENMAARGVGGGGAELAMQLSNQQGSAERANQAGMDIAGQAQRRYFDSILARGRMAGDMRGQDFSERSRAAEARDAMNRYNADARSRANYHNLGLGQQHFDNQMKRAAGQAGMSEALAGMHQKSGQRLANTFSAAGQAGAYGLKDYLDEEEKKNRGDY